RLPPAVLGAAVSRAWVTCTTSAGQPKTRPARTTCTAAAAARSAPASDVRRPDRGRASAYHAAAEAIAAALGSLACVLFGPGAVRAAAASREQVLATRA